MLTLDLPGMNRGTDPIAIALNNPSARHKLMVRAASELSLENVVCALCIGEFRHNPSLAKAQAINACFVAVGSAQEVNIINSQRNQVATTLGRNAYPQGLFDQVYRTLCMNMSDTLSRALEIGRRYEHFLGFHAINGQALTVDRHMVNINKVLGLSNAANRNFANGRIDWRPWTATINTLKNAGFTTRAMFIP